MIGRRGRPARVAVIAVVMAAMLSAPTVGCSLMFVNPAPSPEDRLPIVRCTSSDALPIVDMLVTGVQLMRTALALSATDADYAKAAIPREADIGIGIGMSAGFLTSSIVGFRQTPLSRKQEEDQEEAAVRARAAALARAARADAGSPSEVDAGPAAPLNVPDKAPEHLTPPPPVRQQTDWE